MEIRVDFEPDEKSGVVAVVSGNPDLKARGATQEEAVTALLKVVESYYQAKVASVQFVLEPLEPEEIRGPIPNEKLRALAKKYPPPPGWYEETEEVL